MKMTIQHTAQWLIGYLEPSNKSGNWLNPYLNPKKNRTPIEESKLDEQSNNNTIIHYYINARLLVATTYV